MPDIWSQVKYLPNVRCVPTDTENYQDLIAAADMVVGKAGGSTVAQVIAHRTPMIYTLRENYSENQLLHAALCNFAKSLLVRKNEFEQGAWTQHLDTLADMPLCMVEYGDKWC